MLRGGYAAVAVLALALLPKPCLKKPPPDPDPPVDTPPPPPLPTTSATTPPIWAPPTGPTTVGTTPPTPPPPPPSAELLKARAAADAKDFKKVKSLLDKKVRGGKCAPEESQLLFRACLQLKDKACADAVKAKHPDDVAAE